MERFTELTGTAAPVPMANVDTDMIIRVDRSVGLPRTELGPYALESWRYGTGGTPNQNCVLNQPRYAQPSILICAANFGCGSARETAVWALRGFGIRSLVAPSFGGAFHDNCFENGMLPIRLPAAQVEDLQVLVAKHPTLTVDLVQQEIRGRDLVLSFEVDPLRKTMLMEGLDPIGLTVTREAAIAAFQERADRLRPWQRILSA